MAKCKSTPQEYIKSAFAPQVAILCSEDADNICLKNNLRFVELLQPFSKTISEARISDPSGSSFVITNFKVSFEDMNRRPPQPTLGKKILSDAVTNAPWDQEDIKEIGSGGRGIDISIDLQLTTPWFETWRDLFLQIQYPSDHEFTKHYIACIIVVSAGSENPMDQLNRLSQYQHQQQHQNPSHFPKWFSPNILKYYVLLQDIDQVSKERSSQVFDQMTSAYGPLNCHLLQINSCPLSQSDAHIPDPWSEYMKHRGFVEGVGSLISGNSEASSGTVTPKEEVVGLPSRVSEGDSSESSDIIQLHPLSPVFSSEENEKNIFNPPTDVPLLHNRQTLPIDGLPSHHGACLTSSDIDRLKIFIDEFCLRTLIPHVERQIRYLNDVVTNRSRSKSLLSATRRWLGGNKPPTIATNSVVYSQEATELQTRRLGDLCFMFGLYEMAYNAYYTAKNDFKSDQAWLYFAGAQEMAALASFMQGSTDYPKRYLEGSIQTYLNVCKVYNFAIRLTLLSSEVLKHVGEYGEAAMMFIKMTSEESDLLSALMLEQAAHCFINAKRPLPRKYAFHMTLAGHRFCKAGQRAHSYRAYKQAFQVYFSRGWILAEDHIHYSMGKQSFHLKQTFDSLQATTRLIDQATKRRASSNQSVTQQTAYVREYLNILDKFLKELGNNDQLPTLSIPLLNSQLTKVILGTPQEVPDDKEWHVASHVSFSDEDFREKRWFALEQEILNVAQGSSMLFRPNLHRLSNETPNTISPFVPQKELISVRVVLSNPLSISITISDIQLTYKFFNEANEEEFDSSCIIVEALPGFNLPPESDEEVTLHAWPQRVGRLLITGAAFSLCLTSDMVSATTDSSRKVNVKGKLEFIIKGPRLNNTVAEKTSIIYAKDERLNIKIIPTMPRLSVFLKELPPIMSCGELRKIDVRLCNTGASSLSCLYVATSNPNNVFFSMDDQFSSMDSVQFLAIKNEYDYRLENRVEKVVLPHALSPGETLNGYLWLHAPQVTSTFDIELLFYYEPLNYAIKNSYRLVRHLSSIYLYPSIRLKATSLNSVNLLHQKSKESQHLHSSNIVFHVQNNCEIDCPESTVQIVGVSANSCSWRIKPYYVEELEAISVNQSNQLCVQCIHLPEEKDSLFFSFIPLTPIQELVPSWWRFTLRERLKFRDLSADPPPPNPAANYIAPPLMENEIEALNMKESSTIDMVVTLLWKARRGEEIILGQHSLYLEKIGESAVVPPVKDCGQLEDDKPPIQIIEPETGSKKVVPLPGLNDHLNLVKVTIQYPKDILHDFNKDPLCRIHFKLSLYNSCGSELVSFVDFSTRSTMSDIQLFSPRASTNLLITGASLRKLNLPPWQLTHLESECVVTRPGSYCLGAFTLKVCGLRSCEEVLVEQLLDFQSNVIVRSDSDQTAMKRHLSSELASIQALSILPSS